MNLFQSGNFKLHSGRESTFKIDCEALTDEDWKTLAALVASKLQFGEVIGIPTGGLKFAHYLAVHSYPRWEGKPTLIVDDVLTTGKSLVEQREKLPEDAYVVGIVLFARGKCPPWVFPLFQMPEGWDG
jgi:orotate phosphoribosyltransferase